MRIGDFHSADYRNPLLRGFVRAFGVPDLHSHFRLRPLLRWLQGRPAQSLRVLELGCGGGINLFELARRHRLRGVGVDLSASAIAQARATAQRLGHAGLQFECRSADDATTLPPSDLVLLLDVLEHVQDPAALLQRAAEAVVPGGHLLISVPTPQYPRLFGRAYHRAIGHVMEGYTPQSLSALLAPLPLKLQTLESGTAGLAALACALFYRLEARAPRSRALLAARLPLHLSRLTRDRGPWACSLWAVCEKPASPAAGSIA